MTSTTSRITITLACIFSLLAYGSNAMATECYEQSPNLASAADEYYNLDDTVKLSNAEKNQLTDFFSRIKGRWSGSFTNLECRGPDRAPRLITKRATINAKVSHASALQVSINAEKRYIEARVKKLDTFSLFNIRNIYSVTFPDDNTIVFSERYRRANTYAPEANTSTKKPAVAQAKKYIKKTDQNTKAEPTKIRTSRITELLYTLTLKGNNLTVVRSYYTNGVFVGEEQWAMHAH